MKFDAGSAGAAGGFLFVSFWLYGWVAIGSRPSSLYDTPEHESAWIVTAVWIGLSIVIALAICFNGFFLALLQKYRQARFEAFDPNEKERSFDLGALIPNEQRRAVDAFLKSVESTLRAAHDVLDVSDWDIEDEDELKHLGVSASQSLLLQSRQWQMSSSLNNTSTLSVGVLADKVVANTVLVYSYKGATVPMYVASNVFDDNDQRRWWLRAADVFDCFSISGAHALLRDAQLWLEPGGLRLVYSRAGAIEPEHVNAFVDVCQRFVEALVVFNQSNPDFEAVHKMLMRRLELGHVMFWSAQSSRYAAKSLTDRQKLQVTLFEAIAKTRDIRLLCAFEQQLLEPMWDAITVEAQTAVVGTGVDEQSRRQAFPVQLWQWLCDDLTRDVHGWLSYEPLQVWFATMLARTTPYLPVAQMPPNAQVMAYYTGQWADAERVVDALGQLPLGQQCLWFDALWANMDMPERALVAQAFVPLWADANYDEVSIALWRPKWSGDAEQTDRLLGQMLLHRRDDAQRSDTLELMQRHGAVYSLMALRYMLSQDMLSGAVEDYAENLLERLESQYGEQANAMGQLSLSAQKEQGQLSVAVGQEGGLSEV